GVRVAVIESEAHPDHLFLAIVQKLQDCCRALLHVVADNDLSRRNNATVFDQITEVSIPFLADRGIERNGRLRNLQYLPDLAWRESHAFGDLFGIRLAAELRYQAADRAHDPVDPLKHVDGDTNSPRLIRDGAHHGLPDPPGRISAKLVSATVLELVHRFHQAEVSFLNQVHEFQPAMDKFLGDRDHPAKVCLHELLLRGLRRLYTGEDTFIRSFEFHA